jgi:hypothetical protein
LKWDARVFSHDASLKITNAVSKIESNVENSSVYAGAKLLDRCRVGALNAQFFVGAIVA